MSVFVATTTVDVLRGTAPDAYGDPADVEVLVYQDLPASLVETSRTTLDPVTGAPRTIRRSILRLRPGVSLRGGDLIRDVPSRTDYRVVDVGTPASFAGAADIVCSLTRVTQAG